MNKLLCIVGSTATGKTSYALNEAQNTPSIIVSADSRQVYRGMNVVTGKDHPVGVSIYGVDIVDPDKPCSVSIWYDSVMPHIKKAWTEGLQVIVVGGTGLYVHAITNGIETMQVPINNALRHELSLLTVRELQDQLRQLDRLKFESMNHSDQNNSRRLIRAIEIYKDPFFVKQRTDLKVSENKIIGLKYASTSDQKEAIHQRVIARIQNGAIEETKQLLSKYDVALQSMSAIGYKSIIEHIKGGSKETMIGSWVGDEYAYTKRQMTWFKKKNIIWYDRHI